MKSKIRKIDYSRRFGKQFKKASLEIKKAFRHRLDLFTEDPFNPLLNNHSLSGRFIGQRSINITGDWRAIYIVEQNTVIFIALGTHSQLYK